MDIWFKKIIKHEVRNQTDFKIREFKNGQEFSCLSVIEARDVNTTVSVTGCDTEIEAWTKLSGLLLGDFLQITENEIRTKGSAFIEH